MKLRRQLLLVTVSLIMVPAALSLAGFYLMSQWAVPAMRQSVEQRTHLELDRLRANAIAPLATDDDRQLDQLLASLEKDPSFAWAIVFDERGARRASLGRAPSAPGVEPMVASDGELVVGWTAIEVEGLELGRVGIGHRMARAAQVSRWNTILGIATLIVTLGGVVGAIAFARRFVRPIERMKQFASAVTGGDLTQRIGSAERSELGELARHLDTMTAALQGRDEELALRRAELERAITETRATRDELLRSSRLAAVGEMAGRTAHEVLNPAQSLHARLSRMASDDLPVSRHNVEVLAAIVGAWREARVAGPDALARAFAEPVGEHTALEADLAALDELVAWNREATQRATGDVDFLRRELDRITRIVDGMRSLTRQSSSIARIALGPLLAEACEIVHDSAHKRAITVRCHVADALVVDVDRYELLQVLTNLLRNAMPAIEQRHGSRGGHIDIVAEARGDRVAIEVRDDGVGIPGEHLQRIFEPSFTTRSATEGTGLGLSISRRLVRQMGGELSVAFSTIDVGTTFLVDLPLPKTSTQPEPHARDEHAA